MNRRACCALAICCLARAAAAAPEAAEIVARLDWPGSFAVRCGVPLGGALLMLRGDAEPGGPVTLVAGLDSPFVRAGPLEASGLLREASRPLGFGPGSGVFDEPTGLRLDGSASGPGGFSVALTLVPEALELFWLRPDREPCVLGCTVAALRGPVSLEAVAAASVPGSDAREEWIFKALPTPDGRVLHGASRIGVTLPGFAVTASGGLSAAERAPPGWFALCTAAVGRGDSGIDLLAAGVSGRYLELGGGSGPGGVRAGARLRVAGPPGRIRVRCVLTAGPPGFAPGPFLPAEEEIDVVMERRWPAKGGAWEAGLCASNRIVTGPDGGISDAPSGKLSAGWDSERFQARVAVEVDRDDGASATIAVDAAGAGGRVRAGAKARWAWSAGDGASVSFSGSFRIARGGWDVALRAGVGSIGLAPGGSADVVPEASVEWRVTNRPVSRPAGRAR